MAHRVDRRDFLKAGAAALAGAVLPSGGCATGEERPPNVLLILTDDLNAECVGFAARPRVDTPHLDALAARGAVFDAAYCSAMPCTPSRGCIMAGRDWGRWERVGAGADARLREGEWTWARALADAGYDTALFGKMHFHPMRADHGFAETAYCEHARKRVTAPGAPEDDDYEAWLAERGIVDWQNAAGPEFPTFEQRGRLAGSHTAIAWPHAEEDHAISWLRDRALAWLREAARQRRPFAAVVSFRYPHAPYNPVERFLKQQPPWRIELPPADRSDLEGFPPAIEQMFRSAESERWSDRERRRVLGFYYALVRQVDEAVGAIVAGVDLERTLVVFTSDHGDYTGWRGLFRKRPLLPFEPLARVPLLAAGVGVPRGVRVPEPVGLVDLAPTFLELAAQPLPTDLDGVPLQRRFVDPSGGGRRVVGCVAPDGWGMVRRGHRKYLHRAQHRDTALLFDLAEDPDERRNRIHDSAYASERDELAAAARGLATMEASAT